MLEIYVEVESSDVIFQNHKVNIEVQTNSSTTQT